MPLHYHSGQRSRSSCLACRLAGHPQGMPYITTLALTGKIFSQGWRVIVTSFLYHIYARKSINCLTFLTKEQAFRYTGSKIGGRHATLAVEPTLFCQHPRTHCHAATAR